MDKGLRIKGFGVERDKEKKLIFVMTLRIPMYCKV